MAPEIQGEAHFFCVVGPGARYGVEVTHSPAALACRPDGEAESGRPWTMPAASLRGPSCAAGWKPLPPGRPGYAKRFEWDRPGGRVRSGHQAA
jgi:hypothetical protein